ncbi:hypothetical protein DY000_02059528 [Brassica cretica]|uniref:DJ-1/PfpI domain-containing protein n=1 Tax=Brassica cretica TaxID=69181 RepID=A0ABQ7B1U8_BRACR|nr:hypothetical protein DY000_02059528 [Brassica cretica]
MTTGTINHSKLTIFLEAVDNTYKKVILLPNTYSSILRKHGQSHNCELLQILLCPTDLPSISRFRTAGIGAWFVQRAQRAINTSHVEAESKENGIGFVKLMSVTMRWMLHKLAEMSTLLLSQYFILKEKDGFLEFIEKRIKVNGHMVIVLAEEAWCHSWLPQSIKGGLPGGETLKNCKPLENMVKKQDADGRLNAAICCAPALALGTWGLLEGKKATCYPVFMEKLGATCATAVESRVEIDGRIVTSRGPGTTMEFSVALVEQLFGKEKAAEVSAPLVMRPNPGDEYTITELNQIKWSYENTPQILVPIADGSEEMEAVAIIDVLRRAKANVVVAALGNSLEVVASRKVKLVADVLLDEAEKNSYDLIVLPGGLGGAEAFASSEKLVNMLKKQAESNKPYGAVCASPALVFEPHGLLKGKKATAYPAMCNKLSDQSHIEHRVLVDGNLITSRGPGTSLEFALAIVEKFYGREKGLQLAKATLV